MGGTSTTAITLTSPNAVLSHALVSLPASPTVDTIGVRANGDGEQIRDSTFSAGVGATIMSNAGATLTRDEIIGSGGVNDEQGANSVIEDSLLLIRGTAPGQSFGVLAANGNTVLSVRNDTIINQQSGVWGAGATAGGGGVATLTVRDSIIQGFTNDLQTQGAGSSLITDYNNYGSEASLAGGATIVKGAHDLNVAAGFVSPGTGDFHLAANSPLIDKGDPAGPVAGESITDVYGADRFVAGLGGCSYVRDIGAAELQHGPTASASAPATATAGVPVSFVGSSSCGSSAQSPINSYSWSFDDGAGASTATVQHAFATAGTHHATLTVTAANGLTNAATVAITVAPAAPARPRVAVSGLAVAPGAFTAAASGPSATVAAGSRHRKTGATVSYKLNSSATVTFTVRALLRGRAGAGGRCVAPTRRNRRARKCTRAAPRHGSFSQTGASGRNHFHFTGRLGTHKLAPGSYVLVATARGAARQVTARFRIIA